MKAIAVVDQNWGLGRDGRLLVHLPGDLQYFKEKTIGKTIIMGRETLDGMSGKLLGGRETIVLSRNLNYQADCKIFNSLDELLTFVNNKDKDDVYVAGGEMVYKQLLPYVDTVLITKIDAAFEADRHFPNLDELSHEFEIVWSGEALEENNVRYQFFEYRRKG